MTLPRLAVAALAAALLPRPTPAAPAPAAGPLPRLDEASLVALAVALAVSPAPALEPQAGGDGAATVELAATVRLRQVTFDERPRIRVTLAGAGPARAWWRVERTHLPAEVEPGVVYRDVVLRLTLGGPPEQVEALLEDASRLAAGVRIDAAQPERTAAAAAAPAPVDAPAPASASASAAVGVPEPAAAAAVAPAAPAAPPAGAEAPALAVTAAAAPSTPAPPTPAVAAEVPAAAPPAPEAALPAPALVTIAQARTADGEQVLRLLVGDGRIVERTLDARGVVVAERAAGDLSALPVRSQHRDAQGHVVQVLEAGAGDALEVLRDPMGRFLSARVLRGAGQLAPRG